MKYFRVVRMLDIQGGKSLSEVIHELLFNRCDLRDLRELL